MQRYKLDSTEMVSDSEGPWVCFNEAKFRLSNKDFRLLKMEEVQLRLEDKIVQLMKVEEELTKLQEQYNKLVDLIQMIKGSSCTQ